MIEHLLECSSPKIIFPITFNKLFEILVADPKQYELYAMVLYYMMLE